MDSKVIGSILLIVGTTIGAGMLALPVATAQFGYLGSLVFLFACWFVMTTSAFLLLEVNLCMPFNSNLITMARNTLGLPGQVVAWISFLLLLYSLLSAYISGGSGLLQYLSSVSGIHISTSLSVILFTLIFGSIVYFGIRVIDMVNRGLMSAKIIGYLILMVLLLPDVTTAHLTHFDLSALSKSGALMVTITSFGFSIVVPSLRVYLSGDVKKLRKVILIGSLIPLVCYIIWDTAIMGLLPLQGENGLLSILHANNTTSALVDSLSKIVSSSLVEVLVKFFTSVCVLTSFLGVSLSLTDFLSDGFSLEKVGINRLIISIAAYLPPVLVVLIYPNAFMTALEYAGIYVIVLLIMLPALMAYAARKKYQQAPFRVFGGNLLLMSFILISCAIILYSLVY